MILSFFFIHLQLILSLFLILENPVSSNLQNESVQNAKKTRKTPKILNGTYFEIESSVGVDGNLLAKCTICNEVKKGNISSTGNFLKHFQTKHPLRLAELKLYLKTDEITKKRPLQLKITDSAHLVGTPDVCKIANSILLT